MGKCCITEVKRSSPVCEKTFDLLREQGVGGIAFRQALPYQHCSKILYKCSNIFWEPVDTSKMCAPKFGKHRVIKIHKAGICQFENVILR